MKKYFAALLGLLMLSGSALGITSYGWAHDMDLGSSWDGYLVYLYASPDSSLPSDILADLSTDSNFAPVSGVTDTIEDFGKSGYVYDDESFTVYDPATESGDVEDGYYVVSIVFNDSSITPGVTQWTYLTSASGGTPYQADEIGSAPIKYTTTGTDNGWTTVVPEPSTLALFGLGLVTVVLGSRRYLNK